MAKDAELGFADEVGRQFARQYGLPPMTGRVIGWLLVCDPPNPTIADLADALHASRTAITGAVVSLDDWSWVQRTRTAGERVDRVRLDPDVWLRLLDNPTEYGAIKTLARRGLAALGSSAPGRTARLREMAEFAEFLAERMPALGAEWLASRSTLAGPEQTDPEQKES